MIKEEYVEIMGHSRNYIYYRDLGYTIEVRSPCMIKSKDLMRGSAHKITTICEKCESESTNTFKDYYTYTEGLKSPYYCNKCKIIKYEKTCMDKFGVKNAMQDDSVKNILKNSIIEKYGVDHFSKTSEYKEKYKKTCMDKYNYPNSFQSDEVKSKITDTNLEKYGVAHCMSLDIFKVKNKIKKEDSTLVKYIGLLSEDYKALKYRNSLFEILHGKCGNEFKINKSLLLSRIKSDSYICTVCNPIGVHQSSIEVEVKMFLDENNIKYETRNRKILNGLELDIYIPDKNLAFEINGVYWHNEIYKSENYHKTKTEKCLALGIHLIHIWEDDWKNKKEILKSIMLNRIKIIPDRIFARKCELREVGDTKMVRRFLDENHIQGFSSSQQKIGLFYKNEMVSLMTFGWRYTNGKKECELIRFCNRKNTNVVGASSRIFKYFINNYQTDEIISYSDVSMFDGNMYEKLGFEYSHTSEPNYFWVVDGVRRHRFNFTKKKLVRQGHPSTKTEIEIMHGLGYYRIWGCGQKKWIYHKHPSPPSSKF
jgi:hypothetical protein